MYYHANKPRNIIKAVQVHILELRAFKQKQYNINLHRPKCSMVGLVRELKGVPLGNQSCDNGSQMLPSWGRGYAEVFYRTKRAWSQSEARLYINLLEVELRAIRLAVASFTVLLKGCHIFLVTGNTTAKFYLNKQGDTGSFVQGGITYLAVGNSIWSSPISH